MQVMTAALCARGSRFADSGTRRDPARLADPAPRHLGSVMVPHESRERRSADMALADGRSGESHGSRDDASRGSEIEGRSSCVQPCWRRARPGTLASVAS